MNKNQVIALALGILMLLSTIGFAFYAVSDNAQPGTPKDDETQPEQPATQIKFTADGISAKISELMPVIKIAGSTNEYGIVKIDSAIAQIQGVKNIESLFGDTTKRPLTYVATIYFEKGLTVSDLVKKIEETGLVSGIDGYSYAVVELPKKIVFKSENSDLNLSKEYEFSDSLSNAYVGLNSIKGDEITATVSATFQGAKLVDYLSVEEENISAKPVQGTAVLEVPLKSLEASLFFSGKAFFSSVPEQSALQQSLSLIADVNNAEVQVPAIAPKILVSSPSVLSEEQLRDLNVFVQSLNSQDFSFSNEGAFSASIPFDTDANLLDAKAKITAQIKTMGIENASVEESSDTVYGTLSLTQADSNNSSRQLKQLLESYPLSEITIQQPGQLELTEIFDAETNASYLIDSNSVPAAVKPGHVLSDKISAKISYYIVRNRIAYIAAEEQ